MLSGRCSAAIVIRAVGHICSARAGQNHRLSKFAAAPNDNARESAGQLRHVRRGIRQSSPQLRRGDHHLPVGWKRPDKPAFSSHLANRHRPCPSYHITFNRSPHCTSFGHSAYRSRFVVVAYPWHPLYGQRVRVYRRQGRAGRQILYIERGPAGSVGRDTA
jgi:hypothetical protein